MQKKSMHSMHCASIYIFRIRGILKKVLTSAYKARDCIFEADKVALPLNISNGRKCSRGPFRESADLNSSCSNSFQHLMSSLWTNGH